MGQLTHERLAAAAAKLSYDELLATEANIRDATSESRQKEKKAGARHDALLVDGLTEAVAGDAVAGGEAGRSGDTDGMHETEEDTTTANGPPNEEEAPAR